MAGAATARARGHGDAVANHLGAVRPAGRGRGLAPGPTGVYTAGRQVASVDALIATLYGQTLAVKLGLLLLTGAFGLLTATVVHPQLAARLARLPARLGRLAGAAPARVRTLVLAEVGAGLAILLAAALMSSAAPPAARSSSRPRPRQAR